MANKESPLGLQQTKGSFQVKGLVTGTEKDKFYSELTTRTGKLMRMISFGVTVNSGKNVYLRLNGMERDNVYYSKTTKQGDKKTTDVQKVAWADRFKWRQTHNDYNLIGVHLGIEKTVDDKGNTVNNKKTMVEYDACKEIADVLEDDSPVFVRGALEFSTYNGSHRTNFVPNQISLCQPVDFDKEDFAETANFEQQIVFMGIEKNKEAENEFIISAKTVTYNSIEDIELYVNNPNLAKKFRTLKPYTAIKVHGNIVVENDTSQVKEDNDGWGEANPMERVNNPTTWKLVVIGADSSSIDTELYTKETVEAAMAKIAAEQTVNKDFGSKASDDGDWGEPKNDDSDNDDDDIPW